MFNWRESRKIQWGLITQGVENAGSRRHKHIKWVTKRWFQGFFEICGIKCFQEDEKSRELISILKMCLKKGFKLCILHWLVVLLLWALNLQQEIEPGILGFLFHIINKAGMDFQGHWGQPLWSTWWFNQKLLLLILLLLILLQVLLLLLLLSKFLHWQTFLKCKYYFHL